MSPHLPASAGGPHRRAAAEPVVSHRFFGGSWCMETLGFSDSELSCGVVHLADMSSKVPRCLGKIIELLRHSPELLQHCTITLFGWAVSCTSIQFGARKPMSDLPEEFFADWFERRESQGRKYQITPFRRGRIPSVGQVIPIDPIASCNWRDPSLRIHLQLDEAFVFGFRDVRDRITPPLEAIGRGVEV